jgi:hypothetical protein
MNSCLSVKKESLNQQSEQCFTSFQSRHSEDMSTLTKETNSTFTSSTLQNDAHIQNASLTGELLHQKLVEMATELTNKIQEYIATKNLTDNSIKILPRSEPLDLDPQTILKMTVSQIFENVTRSNSNQQRKTNIIKNIEKEENSPPFEIAAMHTSSSSTNLSHEMHPEDRFQLFSHLGKRKLTFEDSDSESLSLVPRSKRLHKSIVNYT